MQLLRAPATQPRSAVARNCAPSRLNRALLPLRTSVVRRFKEDDKVEDAKQAVQEKAKDARKALTAMDNNTLFPAKGDGKGYASPVKVPAWLPAFTRRREVYAGRLAMLGIVAACFGETLMEGHLGPIGQIRLWTGIDDKLALGLVAAIVAWNAVGALNTKSPTWSQENQQDVKERPPVAPTATDMWPGFGFSKRAEINNGRLAMIGFAAAILNELRTGGLGPLGQVASLFHVNLSEQFYANANKGLLGWFALLLFLSFVVPSQFQNPDDKEEDIY